MAPPPVLQREAFSTEETVINKPKPLARTSPGKLKHNLNINVGALLPGAAPVKPKILGDKTSLDETDETPQPVVLRPPRARPVIRPKSDITISSSESGSFVGVGDTEVLQSVTKDRAKIPVKRRPSTRRARQEAVRKSMTDFSLYKSPEEETVEDHKSVNITETKPLETKQSHIFEDDLFKSATATKPDLAVKTETLFDSDGSEDEDLFPKDLKVAVKKMDETKPVQPAQITKTGLFAHKSDSDSDSGLFSATQKSNKIIPAAKSSLFDDSDSSEDDLFGVKTRAVSTHQSVSSNKKPVIKTANVKKLENKQVTDFDPLSGFK